MRRMTITIERTHRTLNFGGKQIEVEELRVELPFARKPCSLEEVVWQLSIFTDPIVHL